MRGRGGRGSGGRGRGVQIQGCLAPSPLPPALRAFPQLCHSDRWPVALPTSSSCTSPACPSQPERGGGGVGGRDARRSCWCVSSAQGERKSRGQCLAQIDEHGQRARARNCLASGLTKVLVSALALVSALSLQKGTQARRANVANSLNIEGLHAPNKRGEQSVAEVYLAVARKPS